jgi:hypothetical protein
MGKWENEAREGGRTAIRAPGRSGPRYPLSSPAKNEAYCNEDVHPVFRASAFIFGRGAERIPGTRMGTSQAFYPSRVLASEFQFPVTIQCPYKTYE